MTKNLNLILHCGGKVVSQAKLETMPTPEPTASWHPIGHNVLLRQVKETLGTAGLSVIGEAHGVSRDGDRYFGMMQVESAEQSPDYSLVIGVRNSHDKSFPAAICLGAGVFVCDNLSFSGEVKLARRHTRFILRDLPGVVAMGIGKLNDHRQLQARRIEAYKTHELCDRQAHDLVINALDARIITATKIPAVLEEWRKPRHAEFNPRTGWSLFNAFTEVFKGNATKTLPLTQKLHGLMDNSCGVIAAS